MTDPKVPNTSASESSTLVSSGGAKPEPAELPSASSDAPTILEPGNAIPISQALTSLPTSEKTRRESSPSDAPTQLDIRPSHQPPPRSSISTGQAAVLIPGMILGARYEILETIGEGGMGAVYKAQDRELGRTVALKVIRPELASNPDILQRFKQEILLASKVTDRNIIRIYDLGDADGVKFITMEYVQGEDLRSVLRRQGKLAPAEAVEIMEQVASGLAAAHREGIIHRDLKPGNIMRASDGRVLVMDFGLARSLTSDGLTRTGMMLGTMEYMSPEQAQGKELDARSDIFTVGLILYELLTGIMPFQAESAIASLLKRTQQRAIPVSDLDKNIPGVLSNIVSKCLEKDPALRYQTAEGLLSDLRAWQGKSSGSKVSVTAAGLWMNRVRELSWSRIAVATVLLVAIMAGVAWYARRPHATAVVAHSPVSVLVADFQNNTSDSLFDDTLEPMVNVALEGASFINAYNRGAARRQAGKLPNPTSKLDANTARLVAVSQGLSAIVTGSLSSRGSGYKLSLSAIDALTGNTLATANVTAANKDEILLAVPKVAAPIRKALGDTTPESVQLAATQGSFAASNLEAVHQYGLAVEQQYAGKMQEALQSFSKAAELDPNFARAYSGMAATSRSLGNAADSEKYIKLALAHVDRMSERERYRIRGQYYLYTGDYQKCVEEYSALVKLYPADNLGHNNLAGCYNELRNYPKALEELQSALKITPSSLMYRFNISILSTYTGDFQEAEKQARAVMQANPSFEQGYTALAYAQFAQGQLAEAAQSYQTVGKLSPLGASMSASGLADLALYEGRFSDAVRILEAGAAADIATRNSREPEKLTVLAHTQFVWGHNDKALEAARRALLNTQKVNVRFLVAQVFIETGEIQRAREIANALSAELSAEAQADSKLIEGEIALHDKDARKAIQLFTEANKGLETWMGHYDLGRAYLDAGLNVEANSEFDLCMKWRGQAMELLDGPTYGYFPPLYYYLGRSEEGLGSPGAVDSYRKFMSIQEKGNGSALLVDARKRSTQLSSKK